MAVYSCWIPLTGINLMVLLLQVNWARPFFCQLVFFEMCILETPGLNWWATNDLEFVCHCLLRHSAATGSINYSGIIAVPGRVCFVTGVTRPTIFFVFLAMTGLTWSCGGVDICFVLFHTPWRSCSSRNLTKCTRCSSSVTCAHNIYFLEVCLAGPVLTCT